MFSIKSLFPKNNESIKELDLSDIDFNKIAMELIPELRLDDYSEIMKPIHKSFKELDLSGIDFDKIRMQTIPDLPSIEEVTNQDDIIYCIDRLFKKIR